MTVDKDNSQNYNEDSEDLLKNSASAEFTDEKELEKYGVWVKTGPEEIDDLDESSDFNLSDLEEESIITDEEEEILGELEKELSDDNIEITENLSTLTETIENTDLEDLELEDLELEDLELEDLELEELTNTTKISTNPIDEPELEDSFDLDIDFEDDLTEAAELTSDLSDELSIKDENGIQNIEDLGDLELDDLELDDLELDDLELDDIDNIEKKVEVTQEVSNNDTNDIDLSLDDLGDDLDIDILDIENILEEDSEELLIEDIDLDISDLSEDDTELSDFSEDLDELEEVSEKVPDKEELPVPSLDEDIAVEFDETEKIIEDLTEFDDLEEPSFDEVPDKTLPVSTNNIESQNAASEILKKIEQELLSIKNELHDVKKELSTLRPDNSSDSDQQIQTTQLNDPGFFEDDEDETIALTGDELDNILNTADITEETGSETESPDEIPEIEESKDIFETEDLLVDNEDIIIIEDDDSEPENVSLDNIEELDISEENIEVLDEIVFLDDEEISDIIIEDEILPETIDEDILLTDLDTEDISLETIVNTDLTEEIDLDINMEPDENVTDIEIFDEIDIENAQFEEDIIPVVASEPEATTVIDMELPEMQEDSLTDISPQLKTEIKSVLSYMDQLLESLPEDKIDEFANSEHYEVYKKLFEELGLN